MRYFTRGRDKDFIISTAKSKTSFKKMGSLDGSGAARTQVMSYPGYLISMHICLSAYRSMYESDVE